MHNTQLHALHWELYRVNRSQGLNVNCQMRLQDLLVLML